MAEHAQHSAGWGAITKKICIRRGLAPPDTAALRCVSLLQAALIS